MRAHSNLSNAELARRKQLMQEQMKNRPPTFDIKNCAPIVSCEMWKAKAALHDLGQLDRVDAAMRYAEDKSTQIEWEYSTQVVSVGKVADIISRALGWDRSEIERWLSSASSLKNR